MVKHDNFHCIEWPLGVITAIYPDEKGVIRTAEVEECGRRSLRPVLFLVPLELDCHREDDEIRQCLSDNNQGNDDDDDDNDDVTSAVDSTSEAGDQGSPNETADAQDRSFLHSASSTESSHRTSGSSQESSLANGTTSRCNQNASSPNASSPSLPPYHLVPMQASWGEKRDAGMGEPSTQRRQPRRAAQRQRDLMEKLIQERPNLGPPAFRGRRYIYIWGAYGGV